MLMRESGVLARKYDVCLSFAGEDRAYVERVASSLLDAGITASKTMLRRTLQILFVISIVPGVASAKVASTTIANLFQISDRVVIGKVTKIEKLAGFRWARVRVTQDIKGTGSNEVLFLAEPTWTCDTSSATLGDEALLFLTDAAKPETSWHFKSPNKKKLPRNAFLITWSGRGQMPLRTVRNEQFATVWHDVSIPQHVVRIPGPEPEYTFIESFRLADLLEVFDRLLQKRGA